MASTTHTNDPPSKQNGQVSVQGAIDPSLVADNVNSTSTSESAKLPDDEQVLKKTWLTLLPPEQVIEILMKLDEGLPKESEVRREVWPGDLKAAVFHAAVAKIVESSANANGKTVDGKKDEVKASPTATPSPIPASASTPSTTPVPPLTSTLLRRSPPTSTTTYQAAASASSPTAFYTYPYASGSLAYAHSVNHQPYSYSYPSPRVSPASTSTAPVLPQPPIAVSVPVTIPTVPAAAAEDEDDLPSYEEMLVQALTVHNNNNNNENPSGTAPKQLFQWMAATYPLQANFRPSASQALQKAYKRGRFEKNSEGRYRLNPRWEGGNTSRRTTRRPQSYSKAVLNPSPSSHPPANSSQFPPQHYTWTYGQGRRSGSVKSQSRSPAPGPGPGPGSTPVSGGAGVPTTMSGIANGKTETGGATGEVFQEDHKSCMEAAYSILQALNITSAAASGGVVDVSGPSTSTSTSTVTSSTTTATATAGSHAIRTDTTNTSGLQSQVPQAAVTSVPQPSALLPPPAPSSEQQNRAALQGTLALLAAQLAELASLSSLSDPPHAHRATGEEVGGANLLGGIGVNLDLFGGGSDGTGTGAWLGTGVGAGVVIDGEGKR